MPLYLGSTKRKVALNGNTCRVPDMPMRYLDGDVIAYGTDDFEPTYIYTSEVYPNGNKLTYGYECTFDYNTEYEAPTDCLMFIADAAVVSMQANPTWDGTVEYSTDRTEWTVWDGSVITSKCGVIYLRGYDNTKFYNTSIGGTQFVANQNIKCYGNINTMLQYDNPPTSIPSEACYAYMFKGCTRLTKAPELPATSLLGTCYQGMFESCTSLTQAPELPATTVGGSCYLEMFKGCINLIQAPNLPATTAGQACYYGMFNGCTSLTTAPSLPATTVGYQSYYKMFYGCESLTTAPELPATTLVKNCYGYMFYGCTGLTQAPELPATTLAASCYDSMFESCTSLTQAPELPATILADDCYRYMFYGCKSLTTAPELPATTLATRCYQYMFAGTDLTQAPTLPATTIASQCYDSMFANCYSLTQAPELPATILASSCYSGMFRSCYSLTQAPELPATILASNCYAEMFYVSGLIAAPSLPATTLDDYCYKKMFASSDIIQAPDLPATTLAASCYSSMFSNCTSLTQASELPATALADYCYNDMFDGCTSLTQAPELPATTLAYCCYRYMFAGCTSLTQAPELPATTLANECYFSMFKDCTSLTDAPALPAMAIEYQSYRSMFEGCTRLTQAPELPATMLATTSSTESSTDEYNGCYSRMFWKCTSLTHAPNLPAVHVPWNAYSHMFAYCTSLTTPPTIFAKALDGYACQYMFWNCTSLVTASDLQARQLAVYCYQGMFAGCTSLTALPSLPPISALGTDTYQGWYHSMFSGCTSIKLSTSQTGEYTQEYRIPISDGLIDSVTNNTACMFMFNNTGGTFTGSASLGTTYYLHESCGIVEPSVSTDATSEYHTYEHIGNQQLKRDDGAILTFTDLSSALFTWKKDSSFYTDDNWSDCDLTFGMWYHPNIVRLSSDGTGTANSDGVYYRTVYSPNSGVIGLIHTSDYQTYFYNALYEYEYFRFYYEDGCLIAAPMTSAVTSANETETAAQTNSFQSGASMSATLSLSLSDLAISGGSTSGTFAPTAESCTYYSNKYGDRYTAGNYFYIEADRNNFSCNPDQIDYVLSHFDYNIGGIFTITEPAAA